MTGRWIHGTLLAVGFVALAWAVFSLPVPTAGLAAEAQGSLDRTGVTNPVTAVLLNYRAYDTLLEVAVLLLAIVAVWSLRRAEVGTASAPVSPMLWVLLRVLLPLLVLTGAYLLWIGAFAPGGAFQGGALIGGAIVLLLLGGWRYRLTARREGWLRAGLGIGLTVFAVVGLGVMFSGGRLLEFPVAQAGGWILVIETAAMISIGLTLGALFLGGRPDEKSPIEPEARS